MLFNSIDFLLFFPLVTAVYFLLPHRVRWVWLLAASYYFYMCWNVKYVLLIVLSTLTTYAAGLLIRRAEGIPDERRRVRRKKLWVFFGFAVNLSILFFFKYFNFFLDNLSAALALAGKSVARLAVKSKTVSASGVELTAEIRMKDGETSFVNRLNGIEGISGATLVSYNGEYMS